MEAERIGKRVAALRNLRQWTQRDLAHRANISLSLLVKVESGHAPASPAFIGAVAKALRVDVPRITGQPYLYTGAGRTGRLRDAADEIRRAVSCFDYPPDAVPPRTAGELAADVANVSSLGQTGDYLTIADTLPTLLEQLSIAIAAAPDADQPRLQSLLAEAYSGASAIAGLLGYLDLRDRVIDRIELAAGQSDEPLRLARVVWQRSQSLMSIGAYSAALASLSRARSALGTDPVTMDAPTRSVAGSLFLRSAVVAARAAKTEGPGRARQAWDHLGAAREIADLMDSDRNDFGLAFGPSNVAQHEVSVSIDLEESAQALRMARTARLGEHVPAVRRSHHYIDLARAHAMEGQYGPALKCLHAARRVTPQQVRHHPMAREVFMTIAENSRGSQELTSLGNWLGVS